MYNISNFDAIKGYIASRKDDEHVELAVLNGILKGRGCSIKECDAVINGCIKDIILDGVSPLELIQVTDSDGNAISEVDPYYPTRDELIDEIKNLFIGMLDDRATKIVDYLIEKRALSYKVGDCLYRSRSMLPNQPLTL